MIVKLEVLESQQPGVWPHVRVRNEDRTVFYEATLPQEIATLLGQRKVAYFHARVDAQKRLAIGQEAGWHEW